MICSENWTIDSLLLFPYGTWAVSPKNINDSLGSDIDKAFKTVKPPSPLSNIPIGLLFIIIKLVVVDVISVGVEAINFVAEAINSVVEVIKPVTELIIIAPKKLYD